jgi:hypothetical protein
MGKRGNARHRKAGNLDPGGGNGGTGCSRATAFVVTVLIALFAAAGQASAANAPAGYFGVVGGTTDAQAAQMHAGNIQSTRIVFFWKFIQPTGPDHWNWKPSDGALIRDLRAGIVPRLGAFHAPPAWATGGETRPPLANGRQKQRWRDYVAAVVERYGSGGSFWDLHPELPYHPVTTWEVWNEENSKWSWTNPSPRQYAKLFSLTAPVVRALDPAARVFVGGLASQALPNPYDYLDGIYRHLGRGAFDGVVHHPYAKNAQQSFNSVERIRQTMDKNRDAASPILIDEIGWASKPDVPGQLGKTPREQATSLRKAFGLLLGHRQRLHLENVLWYTWIDVHPSRACPWCGWAGLINSDGSPKPAWQALRRFTQPSGSATVSGVVYRDLNASGEFDAGDSGSRDWTIYLDLNGNGSEQRDEPFMVTGASGRYVFTGLDPGDVQVRIRSANGWGCWGGCQRTLHLGSGQSAQADFSVAAGF